MRKYKINYDKKRNCFDLIKDIPSELIWGDPNYIPSPFFTYTIPAYKRAYLLKETLSSVLNQLPVDFEWDIIVVDNEAGAENETEQVVREMNDPRILYYRNVKNIGVDGNYNRCIELARGRWIAMLHSDDLVINDHLRLMGQYIQECGDNGRCPLAYISPQYVEFSSKEKIMLERPNKNCESKDLLTQVLLQENYHGKLKRLRQVDGAVMGDTASLPSFGTVMNRKIMLQEGGFDETLGICEDVITPYRLAKKYQVCKTPKVMGYYRFENNESMKVDTILKIYASMVDFREYMYARNWLMKLWGLLSRNELNRVLAEYCIQMSRFSERRLKKSDFLEIYAPKRQSWLSLKLFQIIMGICRKHLGLDTFDEKCQRLLQNKENEIRQRMEENSEFIIYGAGKAGVCTIKFLKKYFPEIDILCVAVSAVSENMKNLQGFSVQSLDAVKKYAKSATVITAVTIQQYQDEMNEALKKNGFYKVINLLEEIRW